jgi:hypothetical protein
VKALVKVCVVAVAGSLAVGAAGPAAAAPVGVILSELEAAPDQRELAGSLDLLVRSMLGPGQRALVPARELALGLEVLSGGRRREVLIVDPMQAKPLMERLNADRAVLGRLVVDQTRWEVRGQVLGPEGDRLTSVAVQVPPGELNILAKLLAERLSVRLGLTVLERTPTSLEALRPYARAQAQMNAGDSRGAAATLQLADSRPSTNVTSAKQLVDSLARDPAVPPSSRMQMSLLSGDNGGAKLTAEEILKTEPTNVQARAGKARAMAGLGDVENAINEFEPIKNSKDPIAAATNVALLVKRRYSPDRRAMSGAKMTEDEQLELAAKSLSDPDDDARPTLAFMSGAGPNALPPELEEASIGAAERVAARDPALSASVATRALKGGVQVDRALRLTQPQKLEKDELEAIKEKLDALGAAGASASKALGVEIEKRAGVAEKLRLGGLEVGPVDSELEPLAAELRGLIAHFGILQEQLGQRVLVVARQQDEATWYLPFKLRRARLEQGLLRAAWGKPFEMSLVAPAPGTGTLPSGSLTEPFLGTLVEQQGADVVLVHSAQASGTDVELELILFDGASATAYRTRGKVGGMKHAILSMNFLPVAGLALLVVGAVVAWRLRRRSGEITVRVAANDATERRFCVLVSQSAVAPKVTDPKQHAAEFDATTRIKVKYFAKVTEAVTSLERVPAGKWYVHLYGTYKTGKIAHVLSGPEFTQAIELLPQEVCPVTFSLTVMNAEFHVTVQDKSKPVVGVPVWLDNDRDKAVKTGDDGLAVLKVPIGQHMLRVEAGGMLVEKTHVVVKRKAHVIAINLDWERKVDDVSRALDNDPEVIAARSVSATMPAQSSSATMPAQASSAAMPKQPADTAVSLPSEFLPPPEGSI